MFRNGKLFGKLNIIDLLILLLLIAAAVFVGKRFLGGNDNDYGTAQRVKMTFFANEAPALLEGKAAPGDPVVDFDTNTNLGTLTAFDAVPAYVWEYDSTRGEAVQVPVANEAFVTFSCECDGEMAADGLRVNGTKFSIGATFVICAGPTRLQCRLANVEAVG